MVVMGKVVVMSRKNLEIGELFTGLNPSVPGTKGGPLSKLGTDSANPGLSREKVMEKKVADHWGRLLQESYKTL